MSFLKHFRDGLTYLSTKDKQYEDFKNKYGDVVDYASIDAELNIFEDYNKKAYKYAIEMLDREGHQATEAMYANLNSLISRPGSQLPFTSINFGLNYTFEGRFVTKHILQASIDGIGKHHLTAIFPIGIFKYKKDINDRPGTPNYDLLQLAIKSLTKRIYPNLVNCDWTSNDPGIHPLRVVDAPTLNKDYTVTCSIDNTFYESMALEDLFNSIPVEEEEKNGYLVKDIRSLDKTSVTILDSTHSMFGPHIRKFKGMSDEELLEKGMAKVNFITKCGDMISVTTDTFTHNYSKLDGKNYVYSSEYLTGESYDPDTEMATMGCRTMIGYDRHGMGYKKTGRGNVAPVTMILPKLGIEYGICLGERKEADVEGFFKAFDNLLDIAEKSLVDRFNYVCSQSIRAGWFMYDNDVIADGKKAVKSGKVYDAMKHGTLALGYIGIANTCYAMFGKYHHEDPEVMKFADRIIATIKKRADDASERHDLNFSTYSTPKFSWAA